MRSTHF